MEMNLNLDDFQGRQALRKTLEFMPINLVKDYVLALEDELKTISLDYMTNVLKNCEFGLNSLEDRAKVMLYTVELANQVISLKEVMKTSVADYADLDNALR